MATLLLVSAFAFLCPFVVAYTPLADATLRGLPSPNDDFNIQSGALLAPLLIPRVPGTEGQVKAQEHLVSFFATNLPSWSISWHNSTGTTPATGDRQIPFQNLILRRDPPWVAEGDVSRLTLVAHYDSKVTPDGFIGATDSAAPCAMLLHMARSVDAALQKKWDAMEASGDAGMGLDDEKGVQILLLDGEEAWVAWTKTDSLYGSRALAETWDQTPHPALSTFRNPLNSISLFILLDLLGSANPRVPSYFQSTHWAYAHMATLESRLRSLGLLRAAPAAPFLPDSGKTVFSRSFVEDDHVPFMERGVDILHIIPTPFPGVWHTIDDDGEHLDLDTVHDWAQITTAFVAEWMDLEGMMPTAEERRIRKREEGERGQEVKTEL